MTTTFPKIPDNLTFIRQEDNLRGSLRIEFLDARTGRLLDVEEDHNVVVRTSRDSLIRRIAERNDNKLIRRIKLGDDIGTGAFDDPQPPTIFTTTDDMSVVYDSQGELPGLTITYPSDLSVAFGIFLNGQQVMQYVRQEGDDPLAESTGFTSIGLFSLDGVAFAYRRFPMRSITENININILWTLYYGDFTFINLFNFPLEFGTRRTHGTALHFIDYDIDVEFLGTVAPISSKKHGIPLQLHIPTVRINLEVNQTLGWRYLTGVPLYVSIGEAYEFSNVTTVGPYLLEYPPDGWDRFYVDGIPWDETYFSVLEDADPPAEIGDVLEWELFTDPDGFEVIMNPDGTFAFDPDDDGTTQTFQYKLWRVSDYTWYGPEDVTVESPE
jgi:hypothetical protein